MAWSYSNATILRLLEKVKTDMFCNIVSLWIVQIPVAYYLSIHLGLELFGFFIAFLLYDVIYAFSTYYFVNKYTLKLGLLQTEREDKNGFKIRSILDSKIQ